MLYKNSKKDDYELIFVFSPAVIHLQVEYVWDVVHSSQCSKEDIYGKIGVMRPLVNIYKRENLSAVVDDTR